MLIISPDGAEDTVGNRRQRIKHGKAPPTPPAKSERLNRKRPLARASKGPGWTRTAGRSGMVGSLAVAGNIQTLALFLFGDAQANDHVDHFVSNEGNYAGPDHGG